MTAVGAQNAYHARPIPAIFSRVSKYCHMSRSLPRVRFGRFLVVPLVAAASACGPRVSVGSPGVDATSRQAIDPQQVRDQDDMTWDDYLPIPGVDWAHTSSVGSKRTMRVAIVPADYPDFPF